MRAAPLGLFYHSNSQMAFENACNAAAITHGHPSGFLSAGCLASIIACLGPEHEVRVLDFMFLDDPMAEVDWAVAEFRPEVVGISVRNSDNQDSRQPEGFFPQVKELVERLKELSPELRQAVEGLIEEPPPDALMQRALDLAEGTLCPVWAMLKGGTPIRATYRLLD